MITIDIKSLFVFTAAANIFIITLFVSYIKLYKFKNKILTIFILSRILNVFFLFMLYNRSGDPNPIEIIVYNTVNLFIIFYEIYCISFIEREFESKHFKKLIIIPIVFTIVSYFFITSSENNRMAAMSFSVAALYAFSTYILLTKPGKTKIQHIAGYIFMMGSVIISMRAIGALITTDKINMYSTKIILAIPLIFFLIINSLIPFLILFILKEKDNEIIERDNLKLVELNKSKDKFFSIIAHDLRGPFSGLQQIGELLWMNEITDKKREKLTETLYNSSKNTYNLLDNLLKWASANAGILTFKPSTLNLNEIIHTNIRLFNSQVKFKNIRLTCSFDRKLYVFADVDMITTVFRNILSNAIKFTPNNGKIEVILADFNETNNTCTIAIKDNGIGIDKQFQSKIFEIDSTLSTLGTNNEKGTGLGLKLCNEFLKVNNGKIRVESVINEGTSVYITLPIQEL